MGWGPGTHAGEKTGLGKPRSGLKNGMGKIKLRNVLKVYADMWMASGILYVQFCDTEVPSSTVLGRLLLDSIVQPGFNYWSRRRKLYIFVL